MGISVRISIDFNYRCPMIDAIGLAGAALITGGVAWIHPPSGLIVAGIMLLSAAVIASSRPKGDK